MDTEYLIDISEICANHHIEKAFLDALKERGLIEVEESGFIAINQLQQIEKYIHFYYELDINIEGIESIHYMLERIGDLQQEIASLKNRLRLYENLD